MFLSKAYSILLGLYPSGFRAQFGQEMTAVFEQAAAQRRRCRLFLFGAKEMAGLMAGAARERMRHTGPADACEPFPSDTTGAERYIEIVSRRLIHAIANHDFANARYYDLQERKARALLAQLRTQSCESST